jgi:hypothetical protein
MRLNSAVTVGILLSLSVILPGCGDERSSAAGAKTSMSSKAEAGASAASRPCPHPLRGLLDSLDALREKLAVGLTYERYLHEVRAARVVYDGIPVERLALSCLMTAGTPAERALNQYIEAANTWGDCLALVSCDSESIEPKLQHRWALASDLLSSAQRGLRTGRS